MPKAASDDAMTPAIDIRDVSKLYGEVPAVTQFDLAVERGKFTALLGPSGCGKTTVLRMIAGLEAPSSGDIHIMGRRINDIPVHKRNLGMVFQSHALFPHKTVFENVAFGLRYRNVAESAIAERVRAALDLVRLYNCENRMPNQLSGGQQQRVAVARAVVIEPDVLLFDEPFSALDANLREELRIELKRIQQTLAITTVFVTHDQSEALSMADKIVIMQNGRKEQEGPPQEVYGRPATDFVNRFFGHVNDFEGKVASVDGAFATVRIGNALTVKVATPSVHLQAGESVHIGFRAENGAVTPDPDGDAIRVTVSDASFMGMVVRYSLDHQDLRFQVIQPLTGSPLARGTQAFLAIRPAGWRVRKAQ
ncbi:MAG: ABC transporter ATP-binding protein [Pseudorhodoplanes sp.]